jgi:hypothetical protein
MYTVQYRFNGIAVWSSSVLPVTVEAAQSIASGEKNPVLADQSRVVPSSGQSLLDLSV